MFSATTQVVLLSVGPVLRSTCQVRATEIPQHTATRFINQIIIIIIIISN